MRIRRKSIGPLRGMEEEKSLRSNVHGDRTKLIPNRRKRNCKKVYRKVKVKGHAQACLLDLKGGTTGKSQNKLYRLSN